ncbi:MAG: peptidyl-prolyl cis-trans isomerase [Phenylobacterium sp.]
MIAAARRFAKSWFAAIIIGLLVISFGILGFNSDVFNPTPNDSVISAGSRSVTGAEFRRAFEARRQDAEQRMSRPITTELAVENGLDRIVLRELSANAAIGLLLEKIGVRPSEKLVARSLREQPQLFDPITGEFDKQAYAEQLARIGISEQQFERSLSDDIASQHLGAAVMAGLAPPRSYAAMSILYATEQRDAGFFALTPNSVPRPPAPTDAQLTQLMNENRAQLTRPEMRILSIVRFSPATLSKPVAVSEDEVKKRFEFRKDSLTKPETRSLVQVPAKDQAAAQAIAARLGKGEDPASVAKAFGVTPVSFEDKPKTAIPDRKIAEAAFGLAQGQVSGPVQGDLGLAVVKVLKVTPGRQPTLEENREIIEAEVRKDAAAQAVYDQSTAYEDAHAAGSNLAEAAKKVGAPVFTVGPVSKQGQDDQNRPVAGMDEQLLAVAFNLPTGGESELQETGTGEYYAVRVERITPSALPSLAEIRQPLTQVWYERELGKALQAKAAALTARLAKGESLEAVAASAGAPVARAVALDRRTAGQRQLPPPLLQAIFGKRQGEAFSVQVQPVVFAVGKVEAVRPPPAQPVAELAQAMRPQMGAGLFRDMVESGRGAAARRGTVKIDNAKARDVLGLEPATEKGKAAAEKSK